jgi:hypothetical protein
MGTKNHEVGGEVYETQKSKVQSSHNHPKYEIGVQNGQSKTGIVTELTCDWYSVCSTVQNIFAA